MIRAAKASTVSASSKKKNINPVVSMSPLASTNAPPCVLLSVYTLAVLARRTVVCCHPSGDRGKAEAATPPFGAADELYSTGDLRHQRVFLVRAAARQPLSLHDDQRSLPPPR